MVGKNAQEPLSHRALGHKMPPKKVQQIQEPTPEEIAKIDDRGKLSLVPVVEDEAKAE